MRIIFMGTPEFAVPALQTLIDSPHQVVAVYSQPPRPAGRGQKETASPVHRLAEKHGIPVRTPVSLKNAEIQAEFAAWKADVAVVAAYGLLLPEAILTACPKGCINIHPSLLPRWRGAAPIQRTVMAGDKETGIAIMQMDKGLDTGAVLWLETMMVPEKITAGELHDVMAKRGAALVLKVLDAPFTPVPQSPDGITYAEKIRKEEGRLDWGKSAAVLECLIRGLNPWPGAYFDYKNERIKVLEAQVLSHDSPNLPGTVLDDRLTIACGQGALKLLKLQRPGKAAMDAGSLLRGFTIAEGEALG